MQSSFPDAERRKDSPKYIFYIHTPHNSIEASQRLSKIIPDQPALEGVPFEVVGGLDRARALAEEELSIPISPHLTEAEVGDVVTAVNEFCP